MTSLPVWMGCFLCMSVPFVIFDVEVDVSFGLPGFELVGLLDTSVKESKLPYCVRTQHGPFPLVSF